MPAYKDKQSGKWVASFKYVDWKGNTNSKYKRGFKTKKEAIEYENNFMITMAGKPDMLFEEFVEQVYLPYIRPSEYFHDIAPAVSATAPVPVSS